MGKVILIVEDEFIIAQEMESIVQDLGYQVCGFAATAAEAIQKAKEYRPDLVLMDIQLRGEGDGIQAAERINKLYNIPFVYVTAFANQQLLDRAKITEPFGYILKPVEPRTLEVVIAIALYKHQAEKERAELQPRLYLAQKMEAISTLAGGIAHDFNNILTAIIGNISLAMLDNQMQEQSREILTEAENACLLAQNLSRQLLTFSKGGAPIKEVVCLKRLITESAYFACRGSQVNYESSLPDNLWAVEADPGQISQVFQNLVINAIQAMPTGGMIKIQGENIEVAAGSKLPLDVGRYAKVSIQDEGIGILEEHLSIIFDPYFTTKQKGSGLGLATSYSIIKNHYGYISVESELGIGTTFTVYLPASDRQIIRLSKEGRELLSGKGKILVMDDEAMVRGVLGKMLLSLGYSVHFAADGAEAIELFSQSIKLRDPFTAVILDLTVPCGMGGKEAMERLLQIDPQIKAIVSSGYSDDPIMADFQKYGFSGVIPKPYRISDLGKVLKNVLTGKE